MRPRLVHALALGSRELPKCGAVNSRSPPRPFPAPWKTPATFVSPWAWQDFSPCRWDQAQVSRWGPANNSARCLALCLLYTSKRHVEAGRAGVSSMFTLFRLALSPTAKGYKTHRASHPAPWRIDGRYTARREKATQRCPHSARGAGKNPEAEGRPNRPHPALTINRNN